MKAFFAVFSTSLPEGKLATRRRKLRDLLREAGVEAETLTVGPGRTADSAVAKVLAEEGPAVLIALDDECPHPDKAAWLDLLAEQVLSREEPYRPQVVYVTRRADATGILQALHHPIVRHYVRRAERLAWEQEAVQAACGLLEELQDQRSVRSEEARPEALPAFVGQSPSFCRAAMELYEVMRSPYGLVTGEPGVGKMFLIRAIWRQMRGNVRLIVLPCGSFFKDYYVGGVRRRIGGGREAVDQLTPYLKEADHGLLVLHHVEQLPTALQHELAVGLSSSSGDPRLAMRVSGVDSDGLVEYDLNVIATSNSSPEEMEAKGQLIPSLAAKLRKRHARIPSLAERGPEDVLLAAEDILQRIKLREGLPVVPELDAEAARILAFRPWPGNLAELLRTLEQAVRSCRGRTIRRAHLPKSALTTPKPPRGRTLDEIVAEAQRNAIEEALDRNGGSVAKAAADLGRDKGNLYRLMKKLGISTRRRSARRR
jgi:DNA-binding NtrC family response regulator